MVMGSPAFAAVPVNLAVKVDQWPGLGTVPIAINVVLPTSKSADPAKPSSLLWPISRDRV